MFRAKHTPTKFNQRKFFFFFASELKNKLIETLSCLRPHSIPFVHRNHRCFHLILHLKVKPSTENVKINSSKWAEIKAKVKRHRKYVDGTKEMRNSLSARLEVCSGDETPKTEEIFFDEISFSVRFHGIPYDYRVNINAIR